MFKFKVRKAVLKRIKVTKKGKLLKRHQLGVGTHKLKKSKGALQRHKRLSRLSKGDTRQVKKMLGI